MNHTEGHLTSADGVKLYYQTWLPEGAPRGVLVLVHGLGEHGGRYPHLVETLLPAGFAVYAMDNRGHGRSGGQRGFIPSWDAFREDLRGFIAFVAKEQPDRPLFLMGHSLGGLIALDYALHYPEGLRGVVASAPALRNKGISPVLMAVSRVLSRITPFLTVKTGLDASAISRDPEVVRAYQNDPLVHGLGTPRLASESEKTMAWVNARAGDWRLPLLLLHGEADRLVDIEGSRAFFEAAPVEDKRLITYPGGYHESHNDLHHAQAASDVLAWLEAHL